MSLNIQSHNPLDTNRVKVEMEAYLAKKEDAFAFWIQHPQKNPMSVYGSEFQLDLDPEGNDTFE